MQHRPRYKLQPTVDQAVFVRCTKILGTFSAGDFTPLRLPQKQPVTCSIFTVFMCIPAGQAGLPAPRVAANPGGEQRMARAERPRRNFVMRLLALVATATVVAAPAWAQIGSD